MKKTNREERIKIFEETKNAVENGDYLFFNEPSRKTKFLIVDSPFNNISVVNMDSVSALQEYGYDYKCCVLNMASTKTAGGGVTKGAQAQEECLFRCSNLYKVVPQEEYPIKEDELIYSETVTFFRDADYNFLPEHETILADVVTIPAINLNENSYFDDVSQKYVDGIVDKRDNYELVMKSKIRGMLNAAINRNVEVMILGAWGCGVFKNNPRDVANMFRDVLVDEGLMHEFHEVIFAIINDHNSVDNNFEVFKTILEK